MGMILELLHPPVSNNTKYFFNYSMPAAKISDTCQFPCMANWGKPQHFLASEQAARLVTKAVLKTG